LSDNGSPSQSVNSASVALTVKKASPTIATTLSPSSITAGGSVTDSAALTGGYQAGGNVTYEFFLSPTCTGTPTIVGSPVAVANGSVPNSASQKFTTAGGYSWTASYSGDINNNAIVGNCQTLTVVAPPTLSVPGSQSVSAGSTVRFIVNATGAGGCNGVTLSPSGALPAGATFGSTQCFATSATSVFSWTPTDSQAPGDYTVTFTATDANHSVTASQVTIHVSPVSKAAPLPILTYSAFGIVGFLAVVLVAVVLRRAQTPKRKP
jgi:plastocyanin